MFFLASPEKFKNKIDFFRGVSEFLEPYGIESLTKSRMGFLMNISEPFQCFDRTANGS